MKKILILILIMLTLVLLSGAVGCTRDEARFPANLNEMFAGFGRIDVDAEGSDAKVAAYSLMIFSSSKSVRVGEPLRPIYTSLLGEFFTQAVDDPALKERSIIATVKFTDRAGSFIIFDADSIRLYRENLSEFNTLEVPAEMLPLDLPDPWERPEPERQKPKQRM